MRNNEAQREARKKDKLERELRQLKTDMDSKMTEIKTLQQQNERYMQEQTKLEKEIKDNKVGHFYYAKKSLLSKFYFVLYEFYVFFKICEECNIGNIAS